MINILPSSITLVIKIYQGIHFRNKGDKDEK